MRLFIDCSFIDFTVQPTGIPRVVRKYIEAGYVWGAARSIDVVPVIAIKAGLFPVRPVPGKRPPESTLRYADAAMLDEGHGAEAAKLLREAGSSLRAALIATGVPGAVKDVESGVSSLFSVLANEVGANGSLKIAVGTGDIVFFPAYWHDIDPEVLLDLHEAGAQVHILVHDILPISFERFYRTPWRDEFADNLLSVCNHADGVFAVSAYTAREVLAFSRQYGATLDDVTVAHNGYDPLIEDQDVIEAIENETYRSSFVKKKSHEFFKKQQPYLMVGTIEPKKGHIPVIQSFERLWSNGLGRPLALVGRVGWMEDEVVTTIRKSPFFGEKLFWFTDLDDLDLHLAYRYSRALIFGSYAEGFGIPLIEAAKAQLPAICYDTEVAREVAGNTALFYSDFEAFDAHVATIECPESYTFEQAKLAEFSWPSWTETAVAVFDRLHAQSRA